MHASYRTGAQAIALHDGRIHLVLAVMREHRALARVEVRIILQHGDCRRHCIDRRLAGLELRVAILQRLGQRGTHGFLLGRVHVALDHACAAVDHQDWGRGMNHRGHPQGGKRYEHAERLHSTILQSVGASIASPLNMLSRMAASTFSARTQSPIRRILGSCLSPA